MCTQVLAGGAHWVTPSTIPSADTVPCAHPAAGLRLHEGYKQTRALPLRSTRTACERASLRASQRRAQCVDGAVHPGQSPKLPLLGLGPRERRVTDLVLDLTSVKRGTDLIQHGLT